MGTDVLVKKWTSAHVANACERCQRVGFAEQLQFFANSNLSSLPLRLPIEAACVEIRFPYLCLT